MRLISCSDHWSGARAVQKSSAAAGAARRANSSSVARILGNKYTCQYILGQMRYLGAVLLAVFAASAQTKKIESLAPYYATPEVVVDRMLKLGNLQAGEKMFDLGSGDGRIVI